MRRDARRSLALAALVTVAGCAPAPAIVAPGTTLAVAGPARPVPDAAPPGTRPAIANAPVAPPPETPPARVAAPPAPAPPKATSIDTPRVTLDALLARGGPALRDVLGREAEHRFQVLLTVVHEGRATPLERLGHRVDAEYFFPASSMKVPIALAAAERLAALRAGGHAAFTRDALLRLRGAHAGGDPYVTTLAREAFRALVVSDNASANRMLGTVGHREIHEVLWSLGARSARVRTGFATGGELDPAEASPRIEILEGQTVRDELPARRSDLALPPSEASSLDVGKAWVESGRVVPGPMSFAEKNAMRLAELQDALLRVVRPDLVPAGAPRGTADAEDLAYLKRALGTLPSASGLAGYDRNVVADYQLVPFLRGLERVRPRAQLQIFSKVGQAYGFLVANAYVVEKSSGRSFFLSAAVHADEDETVNDDSYEYDAVAFPVLADVAEVAARHVFDDSR